MKEPNIQIKLDLFYNIFLVRNIRKTTCSKTSNYVK